MDTPKAQEEPELIPRSYQLEIYEKALNENLIAVMDTGSGKTLVAAMLIKEMIRREKEANKTPTEVRPKSGFSYDMCLWFTVLTQRLNTLCPTSASSAFSSSTMCLW